MIETILRLRLRGVHFRALHCRWPREMPRNHEPNGAEQCCDSNNNKNTHMATHTGAYAPSFLRRPFTVIDPPTRAVRNEIVVPSSFSVISLRPTLAEPCGT